MAELPAWEPAEAGAGPPAHRVAFAGRQEQLLLLGDELARATDGGARMVLISGEPGIGKTRLVTEFLERAAAGANVLSGRCDEEGLVPYQPLVEALREYMSREGGADLPEDIGPGWLELGRLLPGAASVSPEPAGPMARSLESQRYQLFEGVISMLLRAAREHPLILVMEDLHWSDQPLLLLMRHLLRSRRLRRTLIVATYREAEVREGHPLQRFLAEVGHEENCSRLTLTGLRTEEIAELVDDFLEAGQIAKREEFLRSVAERTDGNPFFVLELFRHYRETGARGDTNPGAVPEGVRELVRARAARLSEPAQTVLTCAAVIGHHFEVAVLQRTSDLPPRELLDGLGEATLAGLVVEVPGVPDHMRFAHAITRDALYSTLSAGERADIHHRVARSLESFGLARALASPEHLAYHYGRSALLGAAEKAVHYARLAGDRALHALAFEDAAAHYEAALRAHELQLTPDPVEQCELLLHLGRAQSGIEGAAFGSTRERRLSIATFGKAARLARKLGSPTLMTRAALEGVGHWLEARISYGVLQTRLVQIHEEVLSALPAGPTPERLAVTASLRTLYSVASQPELRQQCAREVIQIAAQLGDSASYAQGELMTALELWEHGNYPAAIEAYDRCIRSAEGSAHAKALVLQALFMRMLSATRLGDLEQMRNTSRRLGESAEEFRDPIMQTWVQSLFASGFAFMEGAVPAAIGLNRTAFETARQIGSPHIIGNVQTQRFFLLDAVAGWERIRVGWEATLRDGIPLLVSSVAWSAARAGEVTKAAEVLAGFESGAIAFPEYRSRWQALSHAAEAAAMTGRVALAARLYEDLMPSAEHTWDCGSLAFTFGSISRPLGMLATLMEKWDEAEEHFERAIAINKRMGHRPAVAETSLRVAQMLLARGTWGDRARIHELLEFADTEAKVIGLVALEAEVQAVLRGMGRASGTHGLTARELEVLRLIARGLSNREIASELVLSETTIATHVRHILNKTGSANRAQAVSFASQRELT